MNNQEINSRTKEVAKRFGLSGRNTAGKIDPHFRPGKSTKSCARRGGPYGYALNALSVIWLALAAGFLLIPDVARAQYGFENIAFPGDTFTQLLGINDADVIAGYHGATINKGFTLNLPSSFTAENFPGSAQTQVTGINGTSNTSGFYIDTLGNQHGFLDTNGSFSTVDFPGTTFNNLLGLNNTGQAVGFSQTLSGFDTAYVFNPNLPPMTQFTPVPNLPPGASAQATGINDNGQISGFFATPTGGDDGFLWSAGKLTSLSFPGAVMTEALGLNNQGQVVGFYNDPVTGNPHGFIWTAGGGFTSIDDTAAPAATQTTITGINNLGTFVGFAQLPNGNTVGFVGAPITVPEPSLLSLLALGSTALVGMCILRSRRSLR